MGDSTGDTGQADSARARPHRPLPGARLARHVWQARAALFWESLWPALAPALGIAGIFLVLSLFDVPAALPGLLHLALLVVLGIAFVAALGLGARRIALPDRQQALRRIETTSNLAHRPLSVLADRPATSGLEDATARALWQVHQRRAEQALSRLKPVVPHPDLARRDPLALRVGLVLVLLVAVVAAGDAWRDRLGRAVSPDLAGAAPAPPVLDAWITPPTYTGEAPVVLSENGISAVTGPITVPEGSTLLARVHGGSAAPVLAVDQDETPFQAAGQDDHQIEATLDAGSTLAVRQAGQDLGTWSLTIVPDAAPVITFASSPGPTPRHALKVDYTAADDWGLAGIELRIRRQGTDQAMTLPLVAPPGAPREAKASLVRDLTAHPWAGLPVLLTLAARDGRDQVGVSDAFAITLPERPFEHPVARQIIAARKLLVTEPETWREVADVMDALSRKPSDYGEDMVVFLALRSAYFRLDQLDRPPNPHANAEQKAEIATRDQAARDSVVDLMWDTALRIEDGAKSLAERDLRAAQEALERALAEGASDQELERLMSELRQAMNQYMQALAQDAMRRMQRGEAMDPIDPHAQVIDGRELMKMMDRMEELARSGSRDAAQQMLSELQQMMENMRTGQAQEPNPSARETSRSLRELQQMMQDQQRLMDQSLQADRQRDRGEGEAGQQPQAGGETQQGDQAGQDSAGQEGQQMGLENLAGQQEALRQALGEMMRRLDESGAGIPEGLGDAERAMRDAREALGQGEPGEAVPNQSQAMNQMRDAAEGMAQQLQEQAGQSDEGQEQGQRGGNDPFGRPLPNEQFDKGESVRVPDEADLQRARAILDELRRRASDRRRPQDELDYIDRLLRRF
ncbi:TIGR02302 family protein [Zavarzinia sp. CC-PAN008]|uniref:TIGR02302 family protein n=1 Tax=Zavarzinia sp. CC-PAN008 TaxID=3243332 RepID=UPI003F745496